jgi:hypothetical protein
VKAPGLARYVAGQAPTAYDANFFRAELTRIQDALSQLADGSLDVTTTAPAKPRDGMLRRANGTTWNPGSGAGVYCYYAAAWKFLG